MFEPKILIGLTGYKGTGKSSVSKLLTGQMPDGTVTLKMADPFKHAQRGLLYAMDLNEETVERMIEGDLKEAYSNELGCTPREWQQWIGQGSREKWGKDYWAQRWGQCLDNMRPEFVICDDVRQPEESAMIRSRGGYIIGVHTPSVGLTDRHETELSITAELAKADMMITNEMDGFCRLGEEVAKLYERLCTKLIGEGRL